MNKSHDDLTIDELLDDPLTRTIMQADRVDPSELRAMLLALAPLVAHAAMRSSDSDLAARCASGRRAFGRFLRSMDRDGGETSCRAATRSSIRSQFHSTR
jgi:hypothetical protein